MSAISAAKRPLSTKARMNAPWPTLGNSFGHHPAGDIYAAKTHDGQGQIPGLGAVNAQQKVNRGLTGDTLGVHPSLTDDRRRILGSHPFLQPGSQLPALGLDQKTPDLDQTRTGYEAFIRDMRVAPAEIAEQAIFEGSARSEIDVAALGCGGSIPPSVPEQKSLTQPRAGGNDRPVSTALTARVEGLELFGTEARDAVRRRLKVVHQPHLSAAEVAAQTGRFDLPGQVCGGDAAVQNRPGNAKRPQPGSILARPILDGRERRRECPPAPDSGRWEKTPRAPKPGDSSRP